ncbi:MAG TPA: hypothetical protein VEH76_01890 [Methylocystis sp.]|nr:hypothetical protein [Methylocystis sp.]
MPNMLRSAPAAAVFAAAAFTLAPSPASAGVMGLTDQQSAAPASKIDDAAYCYRRRHLGCSTCGACCYGCSTCGGYYGSVYPSYYGYFGYGAPAVGAVTWPCWGRW